MKKYKTLFKLNPILNKDIRKDKTNKNKDNENKKYPPNNWEYNKPVSPNVTESGSVTQIK